MNSPFTARPSMCGADTFRTLVFSLAILLLLSSCVSVVPLEEEVLPSSQLATMRVEELVANEDYPRAFALAQRYLQLSLISEPTFANVVVEYLASLTQDASSDSPFDRYIDHHNRGVLSSFVSAETVPEKQTIHELIHSHSDDPLLEIVSKVLDPGDDETVEAREISELVDSLVTIWVDRGVRFENGVGFADRTVGSGTIISDQGHILTNYHVVESEVDPSYNGFSRLYVKLNETDRIPAHVVSYLKPLDLAIIRAELPSVRPFQLFPSSEPKPGVRVYALGSPVGLQRSITSGVVSSLSRRFLTYGEAMQLDVPINPGNSGGPVVDENGAFVGVAFAGIQDFQGLNFAIPARWTRWAFPQLVAGQEYFPYLGLALAEERGRLLVVYADPEGPAYATGLRSGDYLVALGDARPRTIAQAQRELLRYLAGQLVPVQWESGTSSESAYVPSEPWKPAPLSSTLGNSVDLSAFFALTGAELSPVGNNLGTEMDIVRVVPGSLADESGFSTGDRFIIRSWDYIEDREVLIITLVTKARNDGYIERIFQLQVPTVINNFL